MLPLIRLHRHHPAVYALPVFAAALTIFYLYQTPQVNKETPRPAPGLRRSNAQRRRTSRTNSSDPARVDLAFLNDHASRNELLGRHVYEQSDGTLVTHDLRRDGLAVLDSDASTSDVEDRCQVEVQEACLSLYLYLHLMHRSLDQFQRDRVVSSLETNGFATDLIRYFLGLNQRGELRGHISHWISTQLSHDRQMDYILSNDTLLSSFEGEGYNAQDNAVTEVGLGSENSWAPEANQEEDQDESKNLLALLYAMAQDKNRREGFVHRGITCNWYRLRFCLSLMFHNHFHAARAEVHRGIFLYNLSMIPRL